jgi:hypothetical protein
MSDKHFLFSALDIEPSGLAGPAMKVVKPGKQHLQRLQRLQQIAAACQRMVRKTA